MQTLSFQAPEEMNAQLEAFAKQLDRSKGWVIRAALQEYLEEMQDYQEVVAYKSEYNPKQNISFDALKQKHDLD